MNTKLAIAIGGLTLIAVSYVAARFASNCIIEPVKPVEPVEPIEPITPIEPIEPAVVEPVEPITPIEPTEPESASGILIEPVADTPDLPSLPKTIDPIRAEMIESDRAAGIGHVVSESEMLVPAIPVESSRTIVLATSDWITVTLPSDTKETVNEFQLPNGIRVIKGGKHAERRTVNTQLNSEEDGLDWKSA